jgi:hypothetical protein
MRPPRLMGWAADAKPIRPPRPRSCVVVLKPMRPPRLVVADELDMVFLLCVANSLTESAEVGLARARIDDLANWWADAGTVRNKLETSRPVALVTDCVLMDTGLDHVVRVAMVQF